MKRLVSFVVVLVSSSVLLAQSGSQSPFTGIDWATGTGQWSSPIPSPFDPKKDHGLLTTPAPQVECLGCGKLVPPQHLLVAGACSAPAPVDAAPAAAPSKAAGTAPKVAVSPAPTAKQTPTYDEVPSRDRERFHVPEVTSLALVIFGLSPLLLERRRKREQQSIRI